MNTSSSSRRVAAAVLIVAVVGFNLLPAGRTSAAPAPAPVAPSPIASLAVHGPVGERRVSAVVHAAATEPGSCRQAARRPGFLPASRSPSRRAGSRRRLRPGLEPVPGHARQPSRVRRSERTAQDDPHDGPPSDMYAAAMRPGCPGATAAEIDRRTSVANEALSTTEPVDVTIGGLSGRQVDLQLSPDWTGSCCSTRTTRRPGTTRTPAIDSSCSTPRLAASSGSPSARSTRPTSRHSSPRRCRSSRASQFDFDAVTELRSRASRRGSLA